MTDRRMTDGLLSLIAELESDRSLLLQDRVRRRIEALDRLDAYLLIDELPAPGPRSNDGAVYQRARALCAKLEAANGELYQAIRDQIQRGDGHDLLLKAIDQAGPDGAAVSCVEGDSYDYLDELISGVLHVEKPAAEVGQLDSEMVFYQPTPARHIFDLIRQVALTEKDVLVDLGSGLGHVPILAGICSNAHCIGVELEAAYVHCARQCAQALNLSNVTFVQQDARTANLSAGTVFHLYTPFTGSILRSVLDSLRKQAAHREIWICTFGPCSATVAREPWLKSASTPGADRITVFSSCSWGQRTR
jgi:hypothetical protein